MAGKKIATGAKGKGNPRILVASGVNLDLLGQREPEIYGTMTLQDIEARVRDAIGERANLSFFQTNNEAAYLTRLGEGFDGAVLNPGAWTHTSLALADRLKALRLPFVEIHLSNTQARETFRQKSFAAPHAVGVVQGFGADSYVLGALGLLAFLKEPRE